MFRSVVDSIESWSAGSALVWIITNKLEIKPNEKYLVFFLMLIWITLVTNIEVKVVSFV